MRLVCGTAIPAALRLYQTYGGSVECGSSMPWSSTQVLTLQKRPSARPPTRSRCLAVLAEAILCPARRARLHSAALLRRHDAPYRQILATHCEIARQIIEVGFLFLACTHAWRVGGSGRRWPTVRYGAQPMAHHRSLGCILEEKQSVERGLGSFWKSARAMLLLRRPLFAGQ